MSTDLAVIDEQAILAVRAYEMRREGKSWWDIAEELQVTEREAGRLVSSRLKVAVELIDEGAKRTMLAMELDRLDHLYSIVFPQAQAGDLNAVDKAIKLIQTKAKLLGLENMSITSITNNTVVIQGNTKEYEAALMAYARQTKEITDGSD